MVGGSCAGGAHRCKAKQGRREDGADVWILASKVVRFGGRVQSEKKLILGNHGALCYLIIAQGSDRRWGGRSSLLTGIVRGRDDEDDLAEGGVLLELRVSGSGLALGPGHWVEASTQGRCAVTGYSA